MGRMAKYFKVVEIEVDEFIDKTGEDLDCCQLVVPVGEVVFVAIDEDDQDEMEIPLDCFE